MKNIPSHVKPEDREVWKWKRRVKTLRAELAQVRGSLRSSILIREGYAEELRKRADRITELEQQVKRLTEDADRY